MKECSPDLFAAGLNIPASQYDWLGAVTQQVKANPPAGAWLSEAHTALLRDRAAVSDVLARQIKNLEGALSKGSAVVGAADLISHLRIDDGQRRIGGDLAGRLHNLRRVETALNDAAAAISAHLPQHNPIPKDMKILCEHPIDPLVRSKIMTEIENIERVHKVRVLFACESGSRAWGFASPDSDYDVRFIYVHEPEWYLRVDAQRDVIELPIDSVLDISGWELRKALGLLRKSNPTLFEWMDSPVIYRRDDAFIKRLGSLAPDYFYPTTSRYHYLSMASRNFREYLQGDSVSYKKYLYVLRPLLAVRWIDSGKGVPPMRFADLVAGTVSDEKIIADLNALLEVKMKGREQAFGPRRAVLDAFIEEALAEAKVCPDYKKPRGDAQALDRVLFETVMSPG